MSRIRSIGNCVREIKKVDSNSAVTSNMLRNLIREGKITAFKSGNRSYVSVDEVLEYFNKLH